MDDIIKKPSPLPSHCDTPLTLNNQRKALLKPAPHQYISPKNLCRKEYLKIKRIANIRPPDVFELTKFQDFLLNHFNPSRHGPELSEYRQSHNIAWDIYHLEVKSLFLQFGLEYEDPATPLFAEDPTLQSLYLRKAFFAEAVVMSSSTSVETGTWWKREEDLVVYNKEGVIMICGRNLFIIQTSQLSALVSRDHLTIISDLSGQRFSIQLQALMALSRNNQDCPTPQELTQFLKIGDDILSLAGNEAYNLIYTLEASCVSRFIGNYEGGSWETSRFRRALNTENLELASKLGVIELYNQREELLTTIFDRNPQALAQLYGLYRIWGHPTLEPLLGIIAVKSKGLTPRRSLQHKSDQINNKFKEDFIMRYITHHKEWPELDVTELSASNVIRVHYEKKLHYPIHSFSYNRNHLSLVKFKKIFPVDPKFDLIEFIDDKAISLGLDDLMIEITQNKSIGSSLSRSLLLAFLKSDISDPKEFLDKIDREGFPDWEKAVGLHEKEREGKLKARLFGLLSLVKRSYVVLTEKLIADHIFPYFSEITMTDDERALEKKRFDFTSPANNTYFISLDFSKWNTNMRDGDTREFFETIDQMFGFQNCFQRTHQMFMDSFLYLIDGSYLPDVANGTLVESIGCWKGHLGGIEGLRQKGWTLWTISLIRVVAEKFDFILKIMGQGDNQMLSLTFPDSYDQHAVISQVNEFVHSLDQMLRLIGPPLKSEETWISQDFYLYGKYPILNGVPLTMSWKRSCRLFWCCNEDYPTLESSLSSLAANLFSAIASDNRTLDLFYVYLMECVGCFQNNLRRPYLQTQPFYDLIDQNPILRFKSSNGTLKAIKIVNPLKKNTTLQSEELYWGLLLCPRTLGGYPIVLYPSILVKGFPDQVSFDIATLNNCMRIARPLQSRILRRILNPYLSGDLNYDLLAMNPEVLNLETTPSPSEARRGLMIEFLTTTPRVTQPYVKEFLQLIEKNPNTELLRFLTAPRKVYPKILNTIIQATIQYRAQQVVGKLQKTPTMAKLYQLEGDKDLYTILARSELIHAKSVFRNILSDVNRRDLWNENESSVGYATRLRNIGWGREIVGVDCVPPHEMFTLELVNPSIPCDPDLELDKGFIILRVCGSPSMCRDTMRIGPITPYRGSMTKLKNDSIATKVKSSSPSLLKRVITLASLKNWVYFTGSKLEKLAKGLLSSITDTPFDLLTPEVDQVSGSAQHRLRVDRIDSGGTSSNLPTQATKIQLDTSTFVFLTKGGKNVNFMFQAPMVMSQCLLGEAFLLNQFEIDHGSIFHLHVTNSRSVLPLDEDPPDYSDIPLSLRIARYPDSPYLYFPYSSIEPYIKRSIKFTPEINKATDPHSYYLRFHSLMAYDSFHILDVWSWTTNQEVRRLTNGITINWALNCNITLYIKLLTRLLISSFINIGRALDRKRFFSSVISIIKSSPSASWENLANISFNPEFPSRLLRELKLLDPQTQEITTPYTVGDILKTVIIQHVIQLSNDPTSLLWDEMEFWAPPSVSPVIHPYRVTLLLNLLQIKSEISSVEMSTIREDMFRKIANPSLLPTNWSSPDNLGPRHIIINISSESLDYLCKLIPPPNVINFEPDIRYNSQSVSALNTCAIILSTLKLDIIPRSQLKSIDSSGQPVPTILLDLKRDFSSYYLRPAPLPTSGSYKLLSIIGLFDLPHDYISVCLADGTGGFTRVFAQDERCKNVWYNTLVKEDIFIPQLSPIPYIPDIVDLPSHEASKVRGLDLVNAFPSDITQPEYPEFLASHVPNNVTIITGDAENPSHYEDINLLKIFRGYMRISQVLTPQFGIFKIHANSSQLMDNCCHMLLLVFEEIKLVRSMFSLDSNKEIYILCSKPRLRPVPLVIIEPDSIKFSGSLPYSLQPKFNLLLDDLLNLKKDNQIIRNASHNYTTLLTRHVPVQSLRNILISRHPWMNEDLFNSTVTYKYPNSIHQWYRSFHRSKVDDLQNVRSRIRLEQFSISEIKTIMSAYIFQILLMTDVYQWSWIISKMLRVGVLIWVELINGEWTFIFHMDKIPPPEELNFTRVYSVSETLSRMDLQRICRDVGLSIYLKISYPTIPYGLTYDNLTIHTALYKNNIALKNHHLNDLVYNPDKCKKTGWANYYNHRNFRLHQNQRIQGVPSGTVDYISDDSSY